VTAVSVQIVGAAAAVVACASDSFIDGRGAAVAEAHLD